MTSTAIGVVAALIGLSLVLRGYATIRAIISLFGALVGFVVGSAVVAQVTNTVLFQSQASLIGGAIGAVVFGLLAFFVYKVAMIGGLAAIGFTLGTSLVVALHVDNPTASLIAVRSCWRSSPGASTCRASSSSSSRCSPARA
jgi:hypothetical protein